MYRVLLVDDEENVLEALQSMVEWQMLGVEYIYTARDGQSALEILSQKKIDILITDIKMPRLSGMSLIRKAKTLYPSIRCILLTAYGEFEYAKEAICLGVENYLLKPIIKEEIEQTVATALDNLYGKRQNGEGLLWENVLRRWTGGSITDEELGERAAVLRLNLYLPQYCVICLINKDEEKSDEFRASCKKELCKDSEVYDFWDEKGRYVMIVGGKKIEFDKISEKLYEIAEEKQMLEKVRIAFGSVVSEAAQLYMSYRMACDCIELSDLKKTGFILENDSAMRNFHMDCVVEEVRYLFWCEDKKTRDIGYQHLSNKLHKSIEHQGSGKTLAYLLRSCIKVLCTEFPLEANLQERVFQGSFQIKDGQSKDDFCVEAKRIFYWTYQVFEECYGKYSPIVQLANRYAVDVVLNGVGGSIKEFCNHRGINPAYFGHLYKAETGVFFNDYLIQRRINRSIILLRNPNNKIKDIAEKVGFMSPSYYVKCFREYKGVSPMKYRIASEETR